MPTAYDAMLNVRQTMKFYDQCLDEVRARYGLSRIEIVILSFLKNNPGHDTVAEISDMRMLSKGNVSRGVDSLIQRGMLQRAPDLIDRRWVHLHLLPAAAPILRDIQTASIEFVHRAFDGFTAADLAAFHDLNRRLAENVRRNLERGPSHG